MRKLAFLLIFASLPVFAQAINGLRGQGASIGIGNGISTALSGSVLTVTNNLATSDDRVKIPDGSSTSLGAFFKDDTDNGIYRVGTNEWEFLAGGQSFMRFDQNGATSDITLNRDLSQHRWKFFSANDSQGNVYIDGGGDRTYFGLGETPTTVLSSKTNIQVGGIHPNYSAIAITHIPTSGTSQSINDTIDTNFTYTHTAANVKRITNSALDLYFGAEQNNVSGQLNLSAASIIRSTFQATDTAGTVDESHFGFEKYGLGNGTSVWAIHHTGASQNRYAGEVTIPEVTGTQSVSFGAGLSLPDANYSASCSCGRTTFQVTLMGVPVIGSNGTVYADCFTLDKTTAGFTIYSAIRSFDRNGAYAYSYTTRALWEAVIIPALSGDGITYGDEAEVDRCDWIVRRYF